MWRLERGTGVWKSAAMQIQVDLQRPDRGLLNVVINGQEIRDSLLQVCLPGASSPEELAESYVRQSDLIATYSQLHDRTVRPQIYWRVLSADDSRVGVELVLSVQTSLLKSQPRTFVRNTLFGAESLAVSKHSVEPLSSSVSYREPLMVLHRLGSSSISFVSAAYPADFESAHLSVEDDREDVSISMFPDSLEKGVIRRGRLQGVFLPRDNDIALARQTLAELVATAPPLTT